MILEKLDIELQKWGDNKGQHTGKAVFVGAGGSVTLKLTPAHCNQIFAICADGILHTAREAAENLTCQVIEHQQQIGADNANP